MIHVERFFARFEPWFEGRVERPYPPSRAVFWISAAIIIKLFLFVSLNLDMLPQAVASGAVFECGGDCDSYIGPIENWLSKGTYAPDNRLPGYGAIYLVFRLFMDQPEAMNGLVLLQLLASAVSVYVLALLAVRVFPEHPRVFHLVFLTYAASTYVSIYDRQILTESLATAALVFGVGMLVMSPPRWEAWRGPSAAGAFFAWAIFMRPATLPIIAFAAAYIGGRELFVRQAGARRVRSVVACLLPFVLAAGVWGVRNWRAHRSASDVLPSAISPGLDPLWRAFIGFHQAWGGNFVYWDPRADIHWFGFVAQGWDSTISPKFTEPPSWVSTPEFGRDELLAIRESTLLACDANLPAEVRRVHRDRAIARLDAFSASLKRDRPSVYYLRAPLRATVRLLATSGTYNLFRRPFSELSMPARITKLLMSGLYVSTVVLGLLGIAFGRRATLAWALVAAIPIYVIVIHGAYFRFAENRYLVPAYPFLLIFANGFVMAALRAMKERVVRRPESLAAAVRSVTVFF